MWLHAHQTYYKGDKEHTIMIHERLLTLIKINSEKFSTHSIENFKEYPKQKSCTLQCTSKAIAIEICHNSQDIWK